MYPTARTGLRRIVILKAVMLHARTIVRSISVHTDQLSVEDLDKFATDLSGSGFEVITVTGQPDRRVEVEVSGTTQ